MSKLSFDLFLDESGGFKEDVNNARPAPLLASAKAYQGTFRKSHHVLLCTAYGSRLGGVLQRKECEG